jgi:hypothetical protein
LETAYTEFTILEVSSQVVAGTNYLFLLKGTDDLKFEVRVFKPLPHTHEPAEITEAKILP